MTSVTSFAGCCIEDSGEIMKDCVGVRAGFGRRKFLAVVRVEKWVKIKVVLGLAKIYLICTHSLSNAIIISVSVSSADSGHDIMKSTLSAG